MTTSVLRIPMKKRAYILGFVISGCFSFALLEMFFSTLNTSESISVHGRGKAAFFSLIFEFIPARLVIFFFLIIMVLVILFICKKLKFSKEALVITPQGIVVNVAIIKTGLIQWNEIENIEMVTYSNKKICV